MRRLNLLGRRFPSVPEIRYLLARLLLTPITQPAFVLAWSFWRRRHQAKAAEAHYRARREPQL
jgi:hypothetical protein